MKLSSFDMKNLSDTKILLCRRGSCCPVVEKMENDKFSIKDDYSGEVTLTSDEVGMLFEAVQKLNKKTSN